MTQETFFLVAFWTYAAGLIPAMIATYFIERREEDGGDPWEEVFLLCVPIIMPFYIFCVPGLITQYREQNLRALYRARAGEEQPPSPKEIARRRKQWNRYYVYCGEVELLKPDYLHPGPHVAEPPYPDPRCPGEEHECRARYCSQIVDHHVNPCEWEHKYPRPDLGRIIKLVSDAPLRSVVEVRERQRLTKALDAEYELLGMKDTDDLINRLHAQLQEGP